MSSLSSYIGNVLNIMNGMLHYEGTWCSQCGICLSERYISRCSPLSGSAQKT